MSQSGREAQKIQEVAAEYEAQGYKVVVEPSPTKLPEFLEGFHPDLIAHGPNESVVVEVKMGTQTAASERFGELVQAVQDQPGWRFSLVIIDPRADEVASATQPLLDLKEIRERLERADTLLKTGTPDAAFLLIWVSVEALLRQTAIREGLPLERVPSSALVKELFSLGILSQIELDITQDALPARNALVHGFVTPQLDETTRALAQFAQHLLLELDRNQEQDM